MGGSFASQLQSAEASISTLTASALAAAKIGLSTATVVRSL